MIKVVACACGGSERIARKTLMRAGYKDWADFPLIIGKDESLRYLKKLKSSYNTSTIESYIQEAGPFVIFIGAIKGMKEPEWVDVGHAGIAEKIRAQELIKAFA